MVHLVLCFGIWTLIFSGLFWRLIARQRGGRFHRHKATVEGAIAKQAINHLRRLHFSTLR